MIRHALAALILVVVVFTGTTALAEQTRLNAAEIEEVLVGNTISGTWNGSKYKQFYFPNGTTIYLPQRGPNAERFWRVNVEQNTYQSWGSAVGWSNYRMLRDNGSYLWIDEADNQQPFIVLEGKQVS